MNLADMMWAKTQKGIESANEKAHATVLEAIEKQASRGYSYVDIPISNFERAANEYSLVNRLREEGFEANISMMRVASLWRIGEFDKEEVLHVSWERKES